MSDEPADGDGTSPGGEIQEDDGTTPSEETPDDGDTTPGVETPDDGDTTPGEETPDGGEAATADADIDARERPVAAAPDASGQAGVERWLARVRTDERRRWLGVAAGVVLGLALGVAHWIGLLVGGAVVGLVQPDLGRAVAAGLAFGVLAMVSFVLLAGALGVGELVAFAPAVYVTVAASLGLPLLGSLVRGIV